MMPASAQKDLPEISQTLSWAVSRLKFSAPVTHVYNPLQYAWAPHEAFLKTYGRGRKNVVFVGMNPGPFGMAQTGVPFGDVGMVRDFVGITGPVKKPKNENPKRPVTGFDCSRSEVSGTRFWGWVQARFGTADKFFARFFVVNYCPLVFMEEGGRNVTPDKLPVEEREPLLAICDRALAQSIDFLRPEWVIGVGAFAKKRAEQALENQSVKIGTILHPSPASPVANRGWAPQIEKQLKALGIAL